MIRAMNNIYEDVSEGKVELPITKEVFETYLDTKGIPYPDLLIRTSGEQRLSNYLLWQLAYSEFYFTEVPWPEFNEEELKNAPEIVKGDVLDASFPALKAKGLKYRLQISPKNCVGCGLCVAE